MRCVGVVTEVSPFVPQIPPSALTMRIILIITTTQGYSDPTSIKLVKLLRLIKLTRVLKASRILKRKLMDIGKAKEEL